MFESWQPHRLQPTSLFCPWNSPSKNTGGQSFPSPGDTPNPVIKPGSPILQADSLLSQPPGKKILSYKNHSVIAKCRKFNINTLLLLIHSPYANLHNCSDNLYNNPFPFTQFIQFLSLCPFCLPSSGTIPQTSSYIALMFLKHTNQQIGQKQIFSVFPHCQISSIVGRKIHKWCCIQIRNSMLVESLLKKVIH